MHSRDTLPYSKGSGLRRVEAKFAKLELGSGRSQMPVYLGGDCSGMAAGWLYIVGSQMVLYLPTVLPDVKEVTMSLSCVAGFDPRHSLSAFASIRVSRWAGCWLLCVCVYAIEAVDVIRFE